MGMGRRPTKNLNLPTRMRARRKPGGVYYYYDTGGKPRKEIPLGSDYTEAVQKWAELELDAKPRVTGMLTFKVVSDRYVRDVLPTKAARTQKDNHAELSKLLEFFNDPPAPLESIEPINVRQYLDWRGKTAKTRANREKALFSHIWNKAREWGLTNKPNPCQGVKGFTEEGRDVYTEDAVYAAIYEVADMACQDAMDLAYLCGQRPSDTLKMYETDIHDGTLLVEQGKTKAKLRIIIQGELKKVIDRIIQRKRGYKVRSLALICKDSGAPLGYWGLRQRIDDARDKAVKKHPELKDKIEQFQFRDLRAKAGTDKAESEGSVRAAQKLLGHKNERTTEIYVRRRIGEKVEPTK